MSITRDEGYARLYNEVHVPVFFAKLAEHGVSPSSDQEASDLLRIGHSLHRNAQDQAAKTAAQRGNFIANAADALDEALGVSARHADAGVKTAAAHFSTRPELVEAAAALLG